MDIEGEILKKILENTDESLKNDAKHNAEIKQLRIDFLREREDRKEIRQDIDSLKAFRSKSRGAWWAVLAIGTISATLKAAMAYGILG